MRFGPISEPQSAPQNTKNAPEIYVFSRSRPEHDFSSFLLIFFVNSGRADPSFRLRRRVRNTHSVKIDFSVLGLILNRFCLQFPSNFHLKSTQNRLWRGVGKHVSFWMLFLSILVYFSTPRGIPWAPFFVLWGAFGAHLAPLERIWASLGGLGAYF